MPWKFVDEVEPPSGAEVEVWNGEHRAFAKLKRGRFVAQIAGADQRDPFDDLWIIKGVTHWDFPRKPPA